MQLAEGLDFQRLFESAPGLYLILSRDLTILAVSDDYLRATMTSRDEIIGRGLFDVFPDNPDDPAASGVSNLRASLNFVLQNRESHTMAVQRYDIRRPDGSFEERYWSPCNKPVLGNANEISCIIHRVEDVTAFVHLKNEEAKRMKLTESLQGMVQKMEMEIFQRAQEIQEINRKLLIEIQEREKVESQMRDTEEQIKESQLMFSTIFYEGPVMNTITDVNSGKYIEVNDNFARFCGMAKKDIIGRTSLELNLIADAKYRADLINEIKLKGSARDVVVEVTSNDGDSRWISTSVHIVNINGRDCFFTAMIDITERRRIASQVEKQKQDIQDFIDSMATLCARVALDGRLMIVNKPAIQASGLTMEELLKTNFLEGKWFSYNPDVHTRVIKEFENACSGITVNYDEELFVFGNVLPVNFSLTPIKGTDGSVDYIVAEARDISSLKSTEAALQIQTEELEMANKELEAFSYSVSHDLRAPLRVIGIYSDIMSTDYADRLDDEGRRLLDVITRNVRRMGQLIDVLLNLSQLGRKELIIQPVDMTSLVKSVIAEQHFPIDPSNIRVADLGAINCDNNLIRQVWINLISNAVKYSTGSQNPSIEISSAKSGNEIVYSVRDNGVGFNMKYADKLFGVFQRLHKSNEFEGTGVGLALVLRIITRHGGKVWAEAEVGKGAIFYFSLPVAQSSLFEKKIGFVHPTNTERKTNA